MVRHPFLTVLAAEIVTLALVIVAWNVVQHRRDRGLRMPGWLRL
jgi:hypothetical protein